MFFEIVFSAIFAIKIELCYFMSTLRPFLIQGRILKYVKDRGQRERQFSELVNAMTQSSKE